MGKKIDIAGLWGKAKNDAKTSGFGEAVPLEGGKYKMQLIGAEVGDFGGARQVMTKWVVVAHDDSDKNGTVCTMWSSMAEDRIVWLLRLLVALGVDVDSVEPETENDIIKIFDGLIGENTVADVKVKEKDGYTNMYVNSTTEVDTADLVDPEECMAAIKEAREGKGKGKEDKGSKGSGSKGKEKEEKKKEEEGEGEEVTVEEGDRVSWKSGKETLEGEVVAFDKDDNAMVRPDGQKKTVTVALDKLEKLEEGEKKEEEKGSGKKAGPEEGDVVVVKYKGKDKSGVVDRVKGDSVYVRIKGVDEAVKFDADDVKFATDD